jgi:hypothetical protein
MDKQELKLLKTNFKKFIENSDDEYVKRKVSDDEWDDILENIIK